MTPDCSPCRGRRMTMTTLDIPDRVTRRPQRTRRLPSRLAGTIVDANVEAEDINSFHEFKRNVFAVIDKLTSEMNRRFFQIVTRRQ